MKRLPKQKIIRNALILCLLIQCISSLTLSQISEKCHCDITQSFCDFGCCCDTDCGTSIPSSCFNAKSSFYCPKTQFFKSIKQSSTSSNICYYYNATTASINQQSLTDSQKTQLLSTSLQTVPVSVIFYDNQSIVDAGYKGYKVSSILTIGTKTTFSFVDLQGNCLTAAAASSFGFKFGQNIKIQCICNNCGTPLLFSQIMGKSIPQFLNLPNNDLTFPSVNDLAMTSLKINLVIGKYGSQKIKYIDKIIHSYDANGGDIRTLSINFIESDNIKQQQVSASFFPQIPLDMFYPIHIMS